MVPIALYFWATGKVQRRASNEFLRIALGREPSLIGSLKPFVNFACRILDVVAAATGELKPHDVTVETPEALKEAFGKTTGGVIIVSHLGNMDILRVLMDTETRSRLTIMVHNRHAENYNRILYEYAPEAAANIMQVTEIGVETIITLKQKVEAGGWIVIAGDRIPILSDNHISHVPFFGKKATFPHGPWIIASLLECPSYLLFCIKREGHYYLTLEAFAERIMLPRASRTANLETVTTRYAARLEHFARLAPYQWYNFFDFWTNGT